MATNFTNVNPTRAAIREALDDAGGDWVAALRPLAVYLRAGVALRGRAFLAAVANDLDACGSTTLRVVTIRALEATTDPVAALRLVGRLVDKRDNPEFAARIGREARSQVVGAVWRALRADHEAGQRRALK